jgi:hypothetical protein
MLQTTNSVVSVYRLQETSWEKIYNDALYSNVPVYIEANQDLIDTSFGGQWAFNIYLMMTNWFNDIIIWDKIIDQNSNVYYVKWASVYNDITWKHGEFILTNEYD